MQSSGIPYGKAGASYIGSVAGAQGSFGIKYSVIDGALPEGLALSEDGSIQGTPVTPGNYVFVVRAQDGELVADRLFSLFVDGQTVSAATESPVIHAVMISVIAVESVAVCALGCFAVVVLRRKK